MTFEEMTVSELQKHCNSLNIKLTKADGSRKLKSDLIRSLNSNKSVTHLAEGGARRRRKSSKKSSKRRGSRRGSRRSSRSRRGSRKVSRRHSNRKSGSKKRGSRKKSTRRRRRSRKQEGG